MLLVKDTCDIEDICVISKGHLDIKDTCVTSKGVHL